MQRNQRASGVGLVEHLKIFEDALGYSRKKQRDLSEEGFLEQYAQKFIEKVPEIMQWEGTFNKERTKEFLKNMPGENEKKKDAIIEIIRDVSKTKSNLITEEELEEKIREMGMKGLNLTDKMLFWELRRTWQTVRMWCL
jgi:hypothetical protein